MQTNQNVPRPLSLLLSEAIAYLMGGTFLLFTVSTGLVRSAALTAQIFGYIFIGVAFFLVISVISSFFKSDKLVAVANMIDRELFLALFLVAAVSLFKMVADSKCGISYVLLAVVFLLLTGAAALKLVHKQSAGK
jgi:hypothetical protein